MRTLNEVFAHDTLFVFISHKTNERFIFHNANADDYQQFIEKYNPVYSIRLSTKNFGIINGIKSIPLYAVFCIK